MCEHIPTTKSLKPPRPPVTIKDATWDCQPLGLCVVSVFLPALAGPLSSVALGAHNVGAGCRVYCRGQSCGRPGSRHSEFPNTLSASLPRGDLWGCRPPGEPSLQLPESRFPGAAQGEALRGLGGPSEEQELGVRRPAYVPPQTCHVSLAEPLHPSVPQFPPLTWECSSEMSLRARWERMK